MIDKRDVIAGVSIAGLMLPESIAYSSIAGLPASRAVVAGILGCLIYAMAGKSRFAILAPTSSSAAILAAMLLTLPGDAAAKASYATFAVLVSGGLFLLASVLRLGNLTGFISRPVLRGFALGLALTIILRQIPTLLGLSVVAPSLALNMMPLIRALPSAHLLNLALGVSALVLLLLLKRWPNLPGALIVLAAGILLSSQFDLAQKGVPVVGDIAVVLTWPSLLSADWSTLSRIVQLTLPLALILFAESWGTIRGLAVRHGEDVNANRELGALALANLASALGQGMPVGAGFSAGNASEAAGAQSRFTGVVAALAVASLVLFGGSYVALLPQAIPAAVVIVALLHALDPRPLMRLWRLDRDNYIGVLTAASILVFGVLNGMLIAMALSLGALVARLATPYIARLGRLGGGHAFVDLARHIDAAALPGLGIWRPSVPLFYANADTVFRQITREARAEKSLRIVIVSLEESIDLDSTALDLLLEFDQSMQVNGFETGYARVHDHIRDLLTAASATGLLARCYYSVDEAVAAMSTIAVQTGEPVDAKS